MDRDVVRQAAIVLAFVFTLALNGAANALPLNGQTTAEISDRWQVFVTPAGYVFAIWGLIYLGQLAFVLDQVRPSRRADPVLRSLGLLPAVAGVLNGTWILAWHWEVYPLTLAIMVGLLLTLIAIHLRLVAADPAPEFAARLTRHWPFSIYLGWITVATIVNVAVVLAWAGLAPVFTPAEPWAVAVLGVGLAIAVAFVVRERDPAYGFVIVWAYAGIAVAEQDVPLVAGAAVVGAVIVGLLSIAVAAGTLRGAARLRPA